MNIVDTIILLGLFLGAVTGFVRGFFKQTVIFLGTILVVVLAFLIKNPLSTIMYQNLLLTLFLILIVYFLFCLLNQLPGSLSDKNLQEES